MFQPPTPTPPPAVAVCYIEAILVTFIFQWNGSNIKLAKPAKLDSRGPGGGPWDIKRGTQKKVYAAVVSLSRGGLTPCSLQYANM